MKIIRMVALLLMLMLLFTSCAAVSYIKDKLPPLPSLWGNEKKGSDAEGEKEASGFVLKTGDTVCRILYSPYFADDMYAVLTEFQYALNETTGVKPLMSMDRNTTPEENDSCEILLGPLKGRAQSDVLDVLDGKEGYVVSRNGNKLVVNATSDAMMTIALDYVKENIVAKAKKGAATLPVKDGFSYVEDEVETRYLCGGDKRESVCVVYSDALDHDNLTQHSSDPESTNYKNDWLYDQLRTRYTEVAQPLGVQADTVVLISDAEEPIANGLAIHVGNTNSEAVKTLKSQLETTQYGILCSGDELVFGGWTDTTIMLNFTYFKTVLDHCRNYKTDEVNIPTDHVFSTTYTLFAEGVPAFSAGTLTAAVDTGSGTLTKTVASSTLHNYYTEVTEEDYEAYCKTLIEAGYTLYAENEAENSDCHLPDYFRTYTNDMNMVHVYYIGALGTVHLVTAKLENINLANATPEEYTKITESKITQIRLNYSPSGNFGNCYAITLEDGSFILFDGGGNGQSVNGQPRIPANDHARIYNVLLDLNELNGRKDGKIVIAAWILTHAHWDHFAGFQDFCKTYGKDDNLYIEQYVCHLGSTPYRYNTYNPGNTINDIINIRDNNLEHPFRIVEAYTGQRIEVRNVQIEILNTAEDLLPAAPTYFNDTSMATRLHFRQTDGNGNVLGEQTGIWLGDLYYFSEIAVLNMYGREVKDDAYLKSDFCQVAHHGYNGVTTAIYDVIDAKVILWPTSQSNLNAMSTVGKHAIDRQTGNDYYMIDQWIAAQAQAGRWVIAVADNNNKTVMLPFHVGDFIDTSVDAEGPDLYN